MRLGATASLETGAIAARKVNESEQVNRHGSDL